MPFNLKALGALCAGAVLSAWSAGSGAQTLSDQLTVTLTGQAPATLTANDSATGSEPILEFVELSNSSDPDKFMDNSTAITSNLTTTSAGTSSWSSNVSTWYTSKVNSGTLKEFILAEPNSSTPSDVLLTFVQNSITDSSLGTSYVSNNGNIVALISDPALVASIASFNSIVGISTPVSQLPSLTETGALQDVTSFLYGSAAAAPFAVQVLSSVPEESSLSLLAGGLAVLSLALRRRIRERKPGPVVDR